MPEMQTLEVAAPPRAAELTVAEVLHAQNLVQQVLREVMTEGHHFGSIPGTEYVDEKGKKRPRMALLKPGAEKLCMVFRLAATFTHTTTQLQNGHREYRADCVLTHIASGNVLAQSPGSCSTLESKYRWRTSNRKCPECGADAIRKSKDNGGFYCWAKLHGCGAQFKRNDQRITDQKVGKQENPDIADHYNTCLKMAAKRALVGATLLATAASDMFITDDGDEDREQDDDREETPAQRDQDKAKQEHKDLSDRVAVASKTLGWDWKRLQQAIAELKMPSAEKISALNREQLKQLLDHIEPLADMVPSKGA